MKIGIVVDNELNDDKRVLREISILKENGNEIFVLCFGFDGKSYPGISDINIKRIRISRRLKNTLFFFQNFIPLYEKLWNCEIRKFINRNRLDVIHAHDLYLSKSAYMGIKRSKRSIPLILDLHENYPYAVTTYNWTKGILRGFFSRPERWQKKEAEYLGYPDRIVVLSEEFSEVLCNRYRFLKKENFYPFPNVPDLSQMDSFNIDKSVIRIDITAPVILYFGVVAERRGIFDAIEAFGMVVRQGYKAILLIIGPVDKKDRERFFSLIESAGLKENIVYIPWIDISELPTYLDISEICLAPFIKNPQHESGVANKIYDYMLGSKPVIASDCKPQKELILKYKCGLIYRDIIELRDCIIQLLENRELRQVMGKNGHDAIVNEFNTEMVKEILLSCYKSLNGSIIKPTPVNVAE